MTQDTNYSTKYCYKARQILCYDWQNFPPEMKAAAVWHVHHCQNESPSGAMCRILRQEYPLRSMMTVGKK